MSLCSNYSNLNLDSLKWINSIRLICFETKKIWVCIAICKCDKLEFISPFRWNCCYPCKKKGQKLLPFVGSILVQFYRLEQNEKAAICGLYKCLQFFHSKPPIFLLQSRSSIRYFYKHISAFKAFETFLFAQPWQDRNNASVASVKGTGAPGSPKSATPYCNSLFSKLI